MTVSFSRCVSQSQYAKVCVLSLLVLATGVLTGCAQNEKARGQINGMAGETRRSLETVTSQGDAQKFNPLVVTDKLWVGDVALRIHRGIPLPSKFEGERGIAIVSADPMTIGDIGAAITAQTGIAVRISDMNAGVSSPNAGVRGLSAASVSGPTMNLAYEGTLSGLLERVSGNFGVSWNFNGSTINISRFETRVFVVEALPGTQKTSVDMQGGTSSGGGGGSSGGSGGSSGGGSSGGSAGGSATSTSSMSSKSEVDIKYWDELKEILTSMLGGNGSVVLSPSLGTVTITTTPEVMQSIARYISQENERMTRQIAVNVEVYNLALAKNEDFNLTFSAFLHKMGEFGPITLAGGAAPTSIGGLTGLASASVAVINQGTGHSSLTNVFNALSSIGDTTRVARFPLVTLNNRPVAVRIGHDVSYVAKTDAQTSSSGSSSSTSVTVTPGQINEGFSVQIAPRLLDDGRILLQYSLTSVDLDNMEIFNSQCGVISSASSCTAGAASSTLELPTTTNRSFNQQSVLRSGSMLVIGGVNEKQVNQNSTGVGDPFNFLFGGGTSSGDTDTMMLIAITPQVIDLPQAEHG